MTEHNKLFKTLALCFVLLSLAHQALSQVSSTCTAAVVLVETPGHWEESHILKRIYEVHIQNTHTLCTLRDSVTLDIEAPAGSHIGYTWGITNGVVSVSLAPGQTHAGAGFVLSGPGTPKATVKSIQTCSCPTDPTLGPINPTTAPTDAPTSAPTDAPTPAPTDAPTTAPTEAPTDAPTPAPTQPPETYSLGLKFAILTCNASDIRLGVAEAVLDAVGSQYDVMNAYTWGSGLFELTNEDGSGKYYAIVSTTEMSCWNSNQTAQLANYTSTFNVKMVILYSYPYTTNGLNPGTGVTLQDSDNAYLTLGAALEPSSDVLVFSAQIPISGVYTYDPTITNTSIATPAMYITHGGQQHLAAAIINQYGYSRLEFYIDQADWAIFPVIIGNAWLEWVTNGIFAGARRIEFNAHTDDIFMATGMYDATTHEESETDIVRITPSDLDDVLAWQTDLNTRLPAGSNYTITFPYNGATVVQDKGGYDKDDLFKKAVEIRDHFIWESHTWAHPYLDNLTYAQALAQYTKNLPTILTLFNVTTADQIPNYCKVSTITPSISGLFNPNALKAIYDFGFRYVVGDNSRPELVPDNLYHTLHTTVKDNGFEGIMIVPRHATNIYYDAANPEHVVNLYNYQYEAKLGPSDFDTIVQRDVQVAIKALLSYRHDPFMFHQANLHFNATVYPDGEKHCLLQYWTEAVTEELLKYINLPLISHDHDKLAQMFMDREARDACGFEGTIKFNKDTKEAIGLHATASDTCVFGISGVQASGENVAKYETYGQSEETTWFSMTKDSDFDVTFTSPVARL